MADFHELERFLMDYFNRAGIKPTAARGELFLGLCSTHLAPRQNEDMYFYHAIVDYEPSMMVFNLSDLARELLALIQDSESDASPLVSHPSALSKING